MSETTKPTVVEALTAVKADVGAVGKGGYNKQQNYPFRGIDAVISAVSPALIRHGVVVAPVATTVSYGTVEVGQKRTPMGHCTVVVTYRFHGPGDDHMDVTVPGEAMDSGDKATAKAMSVAYRIALLQALSLPTDDVDPDSQSYERAAAPPPQWEQPLPDPVTDQPWMDRFETRAAAAGTPGQLNGLWEELVLKHERREVTDADGDTLKKLLTHRKGELEASPA